MPDIELKKIKNYALRDLNVKVPNGELLVILGPNGSGKTTLLNVIAGLTDYEGTVLFDGSPVDGVPTNERRIGYLFQNLALFPHLDVASNVGYSIRLKRKKTGKIAREVDELLELMKIEHIRHTYPKNLSGGEKQRVALARVFASSPEVLLLDEPFNSLDIGMCRCLREEIRQIQRELGVTTIFVTHDLTDAKEMGDRFVILNSGKVREVSSKETLSNGGDENRSHGFQDCPHCTVECYCKMKDTSGKDD